MSVHTLSARFVRALPRPSLSASTVVALAILTAACEPTSRINSPSVISGSSKAASAAPSNYVVIANAAVTCTDGVITGNVGTFQATPTGSFTQTTCPIAGNIDVGSDGAQQAFNNFLTTYTALAPKLGDVCTVLTGTLDGVILSPGAYCFDGAATVTGLVTLDGPADGTWSIQVGTSGTGALTGTGFSVALAGGARACNVTWWVADAVTMTGSNIRGNVLAGVAITLTGGTLNGSVSSRSDVTITGTAVAGC